MKHRRHKIAAITLLLALFIVPVYLARISAGTNTAHTYLDAAGLQHLHSISDQDTSLHPDVMESVAASVGLNISAP